MTPETAILVLLSICLLFGAFWHCWPYPFDYIGLLDLRPLLWAILVIALLWLLRIL